MVLAETQKPDLEKNIVPIALIVRGVDGKSRAIQ